MHTPSFTRLLTFSAALAVAASTTHAASITWGLPTNINPAGGAASDLDVSTAGTLVGAFNLGGTGVGNTTVNGTTFTGLALAGSNVTSGNFNFATAGTFAGTNSVGFGSAPFSSLSAPYQALLSSAAGTATGPTPFTLTMSGLVTGQTYQFEWWSSQSRFPVNNLTTATAGNAVSLDYNPTSTGGGVGQFAIGTFVADATNQQVITFTHGGGFASADDVINGFQLREVSVIPEPSTWAFGIALCLPPMLVFRRRARG